MEKYLLPEESIISRSERDQIVLTNYRIRYCTNGGQDVTSIMLDNIGFISVQTESSPALMLLGVAASAAAIILALESEILYTGLAVLVAGVCIFIYFISRRNTIAIISPSGKISFETKGMSIDKVLEFVNEVEKARKNFIRTIQHL